MAMAAGGGVLKSTVDCVNGCIRLCIANFLVLIMISFAVVVEFHLGDAAGINSNRLVVFSIENRTAGLARKLLQSPDDGDGGDNNRIGTACSKEDIAIFQGQTAPLPNGIPSYTVQILNACVSGCSIANIHVSCGWFSSARLVNPRVFRRMYYDDCLVNDGEALGPGDALSFQYANSFSYPLSVSSVACC